MLEGETLAVRWLSQRDAGAVRRILDTSEYIHVRFDSDELLRLLALYPAVGAFSVAPNRPARPDDASLQAFLLTNWAVPPSAWIGGFGVTWSRGAQFGDYLNALLPEIARAAAPRGAHTLYYSGSDIEGDWLQDAFKARGFSLVTLLRSYDKTDWHVPACGSQQVRLRPFAPDDVRAVVAIENRCFDQLWRHDAASFLEVAQTYPYFVVAEDQSGLVGYQFNTVEGSVGYLVRIAVHPRAEGTGVGTRLMADAVGYFRRERVLKIVLNTEERNTRAHALYEWFGFERVMPQGFVLGSTLDTLMPGDATP